MAKLLVHVGRIASTVFFCFCGAATVYAQDTSWTGAYLGVTGGMGWNNTEARTVVSKNGAYFITTDPEQIGLAGVQDLGSQGFTGGVQSGYNWQIGQFVFGIEADFNSLRLSRSKSATVEYLSFLGTFFTVSSDVSTHWLATLRPRIGFATDQFLIFATGGLAFTNAHYRFRFSDTTFAAFETASVSKRTGWTVGGGVEFMVAKNWSVKGEYLFVDFGTAHTGGDVSNTGVFLPFGTLAQEADLSTHIARLGINFKF